MVINSEWLQLRIDFGRKWNATQRKRKISAYPRFLRRHSIHFHPKILLFLFVESGIGSVELRNRCGSTDICQIQTQETFLLPSQPLKSDSVSCYLSCVCGHEMSCSCVFCGKVTSCVLGKCLVLMCFEKAYSTMMWLWK